MNKKDPIIDAAVKFLIGTGILEEEIFLYLTFSFRQSTNKPLTLIDP